MPEGRAAIQTDLDGLKKWADRSLMEFNKKCQVLLLVKNNPIHQTPYTNICWGPPSWETDWQEGALRVLLDTKFNTSQQCAPATQKAGGVLRCIRRSTDSG